LKELVQKLRGGDRRSIGKANAVVREVLAAPSLYGEIIDGLTDEDPLIRMRCADIAEKVSSRHPDWLKPYKRKLIELAARTQEQELRWHLAQMAPRLDLDARERRRIETVLMDFLQDKSRIVQVSALQALADLSIDDANLRRRVLGILEDLRHSASPAVRARARKLLAHFRPR
jgi:hypothetical protein